MTGEVAAGEAPSVVTVEAGAILMAAAAEAAAPVAAELAAV